ncbi:MAG TPA: CHAT domain-containing tetratricopeptide repeat protein [Pyrinomonadaceae bacterium]
MKHAELAALLVEASNAKREALLRENSALANVELAYILKDICLAGWSSQPPRALAAAEALDLLSQFNSDSEVAALRAWGAGLEALVKGQLERAIEKLGESNAQFLALNKLKTASETQVSKLIALALLGRYDEAIECGLRAREVFLAHDDVLSAGKIEHNIGNLCFRRDRYHEAEKFQSSARERFTLVNDQKQLATINNCLANTHALLHRFKSAEALYEQAVRQAELAAVPVTQAEIEGNIGSFALLQGRYDRALDYLERSRRRYTSLGMPHQSATAEQEIADAYLELNLVPEAAAIYEKVIPQFSELGMRAEEARALAYNGRAAILLGHLAEAHELLVEARRLYAAEGNEVGEAMVALTQAQLDYQQGNYAASVSTITQVESRLARSGSWRKLWFAQWLRGEAERAQGNTSAAKTILEQTLREATLNEQPQIIERCSTSLGLLALSLGDTESAEQAFKNAIGVTEKLRAPLPGEEFRTAFFSDKLVPYTELARICLEGSGAASRIREAFGYVEKARARALVDALGSDLRLQTRPRDSFEADLLRQLEDLRQELNYLYNRVNRPSPQSELSDAEIRTVQEALRDRERQTSQIVRQLEHRSEKIFTQVESLDIGDLQRSLGVDTALVEYTTVGDELLAFIITGENIDVVRNLGRESAVAATLTQLRFQIDALRYGSQRMRGHLPDLERRARSHLQLLYDLLLRPIEDRLGQRRLVIVPHRALHYLPFQALHDGSNYLIEHREVSYAPSALVLQQCLRRGRRRLSKSLLLGAADNQTPRVRDEIEMIAPLFPETTALLDADATIEALRQHAPFADVVHLACHGQFRPDNPLFSSLRLGNGWLTVRETYDLNLNCALVTLSACETGVSAVAPGDELIGLARGFFTAGSPSLLISLWTVDDDATAELMTAFYKNLRETGSPAAALRHAQLSVMKTKPHPFFWSPFVLVGRW